MTPPSLGDVWLLRLRRLFRWFLYMQAGALLLSLLLFNRLNPLEGEGSRLYDSLLLTAAVCQALLMSFALLMPAYFGLAARRRKGWPARLRSFYLGQALRLSLLNGMVLFNAAAVGLLGDKTYLLLFLVALALFSSCWPTRGAAIRSLRLSPDEAQALFG